MRILVAAVAFAVLVVGLFVWLMNGHSGDGANAAGAPAVARMGPLEPDTNRQGRDLADIGLRLTDAAACSRLCALDERCLAMSFVKAADGASGICWLKGSVPSASENPSVVSAIKIQAEH